MTEYEIRAVSRTDEWDVFYRREWIATFATKTDAEIFIKIKKINDILTA
jgi:hypothetical protein